MTNEERMREALYEIANRASNMGDPDAADWMPSIYKIACEATGEDPWRLLKALGYTPEKLPVDLMVTIEERPDGGIRVYSDALPGLILSGPDRLKVLADIEPACRALLEYKGIDASNLMIDATFVHVRF